MTDRRYSFSWTQANPNPEHTGIEHLQQMIAGDLPMPPMTQLMNLQLLEVEPGRVVISTEPSEMHYNPIGTVHGGLAATLFDTALGLSILSKFPAGSIPATIELHVNYLRAMRVDTGRVICEGKAIHVGRQLATSEAKLIGESDGKIYGHATTTCVVMPMPDAMDADTTTYSTDITWEDPMPGVQAGMQMLGLDYMQALSRGEYPIPPIASLMGMSMANIIGGKAEFGAIPKPYQTNLMGSIHGGFAATLLDSALGCAVHTTMPDGLVYTTAELKVNYIRPITPESGEVRAIANVIHSGRRMAIADAKLVDADDKLLGYGSTTCLVFPNPMLK